MAGTTELFNDMKNLWNSLEENHAIFSEKGNKAAGTRARRLLENSKKSLQIIGRLLLLKASR